MKARMLILIGIVVAISLAVSCGKPDESVTSRVKANLAADETVKSYEIEVSTQNGVVTLTGNVDGQAAKDRAMDLARGTEGVTSVVDMIAVRTTESTGDAPDPGRSLGERIDDAGITMAVKAKLLDDSLVKGLKIDVDTRDGVVYLTGTVKSSAERDQAVKLARETDNVRDVQANLDVEG